MGLKAYTTKLILPSKLIQRYGLQTSFLMHLKLSPGEIRLAKVRPENTLLYDKNFNFIFSIKPIQEGKLNQKLIDDIIRHHTHYIGYEFERTCRTLLPHLFPGAQILHQKTLVKNENGRRIAIRPDATIFEEGKPIHFVDYKKSVGAIRKRTTAYLRLFPKSKLSFLILEKYGWNWRIKRVKNILKHEKFSDKEIEAFLQRINFIKVTDIVPLLPADVRAEFIKNLDDLSKNLSLDRAEVIEKLEAQNKSIITRLKKLGVTQSDLDKILEVHRSFSFTWENLLLIEKIVTMKHVTPKNLTDSHFSLDKVKNRLKQLKKLGLVKSKKYRIGVSNKYFYYFYNKTPPDLSTVLDPLASNGMKILSNNGFIQKKMDPSDFLRTKLGSYWIRALRVVSLLNQYGMATISELVSLGASDNEKTCGMAVFSIGKQGLIEKFRAFADNGKQNVVYYLKYNYPNGVPIKDQIPYIKSDQQGTLRKFLESGIEIPNFTDFKDWLGKNWHVAIDIYNLALNEKLQVLEINSISDHLSNNIHSIRNALKTLHQIKALDRYDWFNRSYYYQLRGSPEILLTDNPLLPLKIKETLGYIEKISNMHFIDLMDLRRTMSRHWRGSLKALEIIKEDPKSVAEGINRQKLIRLLRDRGVSLDHEGSLDRYLRPLRKLGIISQYKEADRMKYKINLQRLINT
jgi:hypothetical protein